MKPGDLVLLDQFLDLTKGKRADTFFDADGELRHTDMTYPYSEKLRSLVRAASEKEGVDLILTGTYGCFEGPRFETAAEANMARLLGAHVVGMTGYPEVALARELGLEFCAVAVVSNYAPGVVGNTVSVEEVTEATAQRIGEVVQLARPSSKAHRARDGESRQMRTIDWESNSIRIIDQTALPGELRVITLETIEQLVDAIRRLAVRGAPALGAAGALGVALAAVIYNGDEDRVRQAAVTVREAWPTAVNLAWGVDRALGILEKGTEAVIAEALALLEEDAAINRRIGRRGAELISELGLKEVSALTHCNTGALACVEWGTALGILRQLNADGRLKKVIATETRPLLQGARLTAWELAEMGVEHSLIVDSAAAWVLTSHLVDLVVVGADRIAANGDVANKIGTLSLAIAAKYAGIPFIVAAPESTVDANTPGGGAIPIEYRDGEEVTTWRGLTSSPSGTRALNPAFDVTPHELIAAVVTEDRVIRPAENSGTANCRSAL